MKFLLLTRKPRNNALKNVDDFYVLDLLRDKTKLAFKKMFSLSHPQYTTDISIMVEPSSRIVSIETAANGGAIQSLPGS
jgi:hypothetical protein